jgi:hypothetical protein
MKFLKLFDEMNTSIDSDLISEIFNEIKDDFDLEKIDIDDVVRLDLEPKFVNISTFEKLLKEEYPELYKSVCNFIDSVERSEMVECYWHSTLRHGFSFTYYHISMSFQVKKILGTIYLFNLIPINYINKIRKV